MYKHLKIGFELEFVCNLDKDKFKKELNNLLGKDKVKLYSQYNSVYRQTKSKYLRDGYFICLKYDVENAINKIKTPPLAYNQAKFQLNSLFNFINENCITTKLCRFNVNISFDENIFGKYFLYNINPLTYLLDFDETKIFNKIQAARATNTNTINRIITKNPTKSILDKKTISTQKFVINETNFPTVDLRKRFKNYLKFCFFGGENYQKTIKPLWDSINYIFNYTYNHIKTKGTLSLSGKEKLIKLANKYNKIYAACLDIGSFKKRFPNITLLIDTREYNLNNKIIFFADKLYEFLALSNVRDATINYDTTNDCFELLNCDSKLLYNLENCVLINCNITNAFFKNVILENCTVKNSIVEHSNLINCSVDGTLLQSCVQDGGDSNMCYIDGDFSHTMGNLKKCVVRNTCLSGAYSVDDDTVILNLSKNKKLNDVR